MNKLETAPDYEKIIYSKERSERIITLVQNLDFNITVNEANESYYYWDKVKYLKIPEGVTHEEVWAFAKFRRGNTPFRIQFGKYLFAWFLTAKIQEYLHFFDLNIGGSLESKSIIPQGDKNRYLISSIMEEAIASSQIEGAVTTRKEAKEMLRKNNNLRNKSEQMILNNYLSIQKIIEWKHESLTEEKLLELHALVTSKTLDVKKDEGRFRDNDEINVVDVTDGEVVHYPPPVGEVDELIKSLITFFNNDSKEIFVHPKIKASIIHFMIGYIHPFVDGNGRTARALFYWFLLKKGYWLTEYLSISRMILKSKDQYAKAFLYTETDQNDLTYFINYQLRTMKLAYDSLMEYIQRKIEEKRRVSDFLKIDKVNERQALILKWLYEEPSLILSVKEIEIRLSVSNQTARTDLQGLVDSGYLEMIQLNQKAKEFARSKNFEENIHERIGVK